MSTSDDLRARLAAWERDHPEHDPERIHFTLTHDSAGIEEKFPPLSPDEIRNVAGLYEDLQRQLRHEEETRRLAEADQAEMLADDIARHWPR